jgi:hypothetical protein
MTTPSVDSTTVVQFSDGEFVVPVWWMRSLNRRTTGYTNGVRIVNCTLNEMRQFVNNDMLSDTWSDAIRRQRSRAR